MKITPPAFCIGTLIEMAERQFSIWFLGLHSQNAPPSRRQARGRIAPRIREAGDVESESASPAATFTQQYTTRCPINSPRFIFRLGSEKRKPQPGEKLRFHRRQESIDGIDSITATMPRSCAPGRYSGSPSCGHPDFRCEQEVFIASTMLPRLAHAKAKNADPRTRRPCSGL
jgi:hypothetical protein